MTNQSFALPGQMIPYSQEAEEAVLGAVMVNPESFAGVASFLKPDDFYILRNQFIWEAILRLGERNDPIDYLTLQDELRMLQRLNDVGGPAYLTHLINSVPTSVHAEIYGRLVERASIRRRLLIAADEIKALAFDEELGIEQVTNDAESRLFKVTERNVRRDIVSLRQALGDYFDRVAHLMQYPNETSGLPTGFRDIDTLLGGLQKSDLLIFAGRPGMGKCVAAGTLIQTERGLVPVESLKPEGVKPIPDDEGGCYYPLEIDVVTANGIATTSHFYDSGERATLRLTTRSGLSLMGTYVHPVLVLNQQGEKVWKPLAQLEVGDFVAVRNHRELSSMTIFRRVRTASSGFPTENVAWGSQPQAEEWDAVVSVEDAGIQHCYDLTVPGEQSFVANGIVNHNTSFLLSVTSQAARTGARIGIFSMEMGADQIVQRLISMETGINSQRLRLGQLTQQEWLRFVRATEYLQNYKIFIDDSPALTPLQLRTKCRRIAHEHGLDLIIVDYLQLMNGGGTFENNRVQEISYISRSLKELARELNVPLFAAAQLSRAVEQRQDKRPQLSDLRESGSIEQDSDIVMFLYRDIVYNEATEFPNRADIIVSKHRNGPTGVVSLHFDGALTKFTDAKTQTIDLSSL